MIGVGIGIPFFRSFGVPIDAQAQAHFNRVIADGGVVPSGLSGVNAFFSAVKAIYGTSDINTAIRAAYDPHYLGYRLGSGSGTTLEQAARTLYSCSGASADVVQTTAASQPLLLEHKGTNYFYNSGVSGNTLSTPSSAANQITGSVDFDFCFEILPTGNFSQGFGKAFGNGTSPSYACFISAGGNVQYVDRLGNYTTIVNISSFAPSAGNLFWVRITLVGTTATCFTSTNGTIWTSRGTATVADLSVSNSSPVIFSAGSFTGVQSKGYRLRVFNGLRDSGGTLVVDCNPASYNPATSQTQWTSATGEEWTLNKDNASTGYKSVLVDRTLVQADGINDTMLAPSNLTRQFYTQYVVGNYQSSTASARIVSGNADAHVILASGVGVYSAFNGVDLVFNGEQANRLQMYTVNFNNTTSSTFVNNANQTNGSTGTASSNGIAIFSRVVGTNPANAILTSLVVAVAVDTIEQRTSIYNALRGFNNSSI